MTCAARTLEINERDMVLHLHLFVFPLFKADVSSPCEEEGHTTPKNMENKKI